MTASVRPYFEVDDVEPLIDESVGFRVLGCEPGAVVTIRVAQVDAGAKLVSEASFEADGTGVVDPAIQPAMSGTYVGVDPYGLWWSAVYESEPGRETGAIPCDLKASVDEAGVAHASLVRRVSAPGVDVEKVTEGGLFGYFARPPGTGPFPGVVIVGGSGGGVSQTSATLLASHGIAALTVGYFGVPGRPDILADIELEYFQGAIRWPSGRPEVRGSQVAVMGTSRGGELALLLGATFPEIAAVVALVPSGIVFPGLGGQGKERPPSWTYGGRPVPMAVFPLDSSESDEEDVEVPLEGSPRVERMLDAHPEIATAAEIPIERTQGPILLISGDHDAMWPSTRLAEIAVDRARRHAFAYPIQHLVYRGAGHLCTLVPGLPPLSDYVHAIAKRRVAFGGTPADNAAAQRDSWRRRLAFLHAYAGSHTGIAG